MLARTYRPRDASAGNRAMNGYLSDRVQVTLIYLPFQSPANRSLRVPTVSLKRPAKTKQAPNADGFPSWEESVGFCEERAGGEAAFRYQEAIGGAGSGHVFSHGPGLVPVCPSRFGATWLGSTDSLWFLAMPKEWDRGTESLLPESCGSRLGPATLCSCPRSKLAEYREVSSRCVSIADGSRS